MLAGPAPEVLIGPLAAATGRIRVGSGGVMLPHYSPFKVAETFSLLAGLFPGRIDLGLGRAAGTDALTMYALQRDRREASPDDFPQQLAELLGHLEDDLPSDHPFAHLAASLPGRPEAPEPWLLGSSPQSGIWAAAARPAVRLRRLHQPRRRGDRDRLPARVRPGPAARRAARRGRHVGAGRRHGGGGVAARRVLAHGDGDAAARAADPRARRSTRRCASSRPRASRRRAGGSRRGRPNRSAPRWRRSRSSTGPTR